MPDNIIISSRIRLARNIDGIPHPQLISKQDANALGSKIYKAVNTSGDYKAYCMSGVESIEDNILKEKHLISEDLLEKKDSGLAIINSKENVSIMVNEEDHIREQCILPGKDLYRAYDIINKIDDKISGSLKFSFDQQLGYLTTCPTNVGTGLRASVMMFLPGLVLADVLSHCVKNITKHNMTMRGAYGEGSASNGNIFQVSNQRTLGQSESGIIDEVIGCVGYLEAIEIECRNTLMQTNPASLKDKIMRAYGVLTNAYKLGSDEFMDCIALVKLGVYYDIIRVSDFEMFDDIIIKMQPASLISMAGGEFLQPEERDVFRAKCVALTLRQCCKIKDGMYY